MNPWSVEECGPNIESIRQLARLTLYGELIRGSYARPRLKVGIRVFSDTPLTYCNMIQNNVRGILLFLSGEQSGRMSNRLKPRGIVSKAQVE